MTIDEIKDYIKDYFIEHDCQIFEETPLKPEFLDVAAIRYQYFGDYMFDVYKYDLPHCLFHNHKWFLLEMVNPKIAPKTGSMHTALKGVLDNIDTELWNLAYKYYDRIGHDKFGKLSPWLDEHRDILYSLDYDMV